LRTRAHLGSTFYDVASFKAGRSTLRPLEREELGDVRGRSLLHLQCHWRSLAATFPPDIPTHSRQQTFYFDERGWLRRLDYTAEVFYSWATSSHLCYDHKRFSGILVPTRRRVVPRLGERTLPGPTIIWIEVEEFELIPRHGEQVAKKVADPG